MSRRVCERCERECAALLHDPTTNVLRENPPGSVIRAYRSPRMICTRCTDEIRRGIERRTKRPAPSKGLAPVQAWLPSTDVDCRPPAKPPSKAEIKRLERAAKAGAP